MAKKKNAYKRKETGKKSQDPTVLMGKIPKISLDFSFLNDKRFTLSVGLLMLCFSVFLGLSLLSYLFSGKADQSVVESVSFGELITSGQEVQNWLGLAGAGLAHLFVYEWFGIASVMFVPILFSAGYETISKKKMLPLRRSTQLATFLAFWLSLLLGYIVEISNGSTELHFLCGGIGLHVAQVFDSLVGWGTLFFLIFSMGVFLIYFFKEETFYRFQASIKNRAEKVGKPAAATAPDTDVDGTDDSGFTATDGEDRTSDKPDGQTQAPAQNGQSRATDGSQFPVPTTGRTITLSTERETDFLAEGGKHDGLELSIDDRTGIQEATVMSSTGGRPPISDEHGQLIIEDGNLYDPKLDLPHYKLPPLDLLGDAPAAKVKVTTEELQANKDRIIETLSNFKIGITSIKATIGPTVTLYEIVPEAGIKISRIKNLEDDIALSLAALGIRIIAPIPGKGTIGIEVPNKNREMVAVKSVLATDKFMNADKELPIVLGKTISNEVFVTDLTKMPHLLIAGATGQGKSVGLNVVLTSLLYRRHPSELKFVLVDPKKVELSLYNKIERHYLAALPDAEDTILTETGKVVEVLNSLCVEMDMRYNLLKNAGCRNLKEYNRKFINRRLNPEKGHRYLPYIVLVIDELADLMMTAGKEVEMPIARLAQLARAIGIHLIVATQRPSVDVITGLIKANFPARLSFKVTSRVDSRTILDTGGAEQLIGMGDMLLSNSSDLIRLQCAYVDTDEVEKVCDFISEQHGYDTAYMLPEYQDETATDEPGKIDLTKRDALFDDAARLIVLHQQGSTSLVQRKLSLGYNRAGRIIDQLEAAGIVGPFEGSKARQVLVDEFSLEKILESLNNG